MNTEVPTCNEEMFGANVSMLMYLSGSTQTFDRIINDESSPSHKQLHNPS